jgi:hypothetical protein
MTRRLLHLRDEGSSPGSIACATLAQVREPAGAPAGAETWGSVAPVTALDIGSAIKLRTRFTRIGDTVAPRPAQRAELVRRSQPQSPANQDHEPEEKHHGHRTSEPAHPAPPAAAGVVEHAFRAAVGPHRTQPRASWPRRAGAAVTVTTYVRRGGTPRRRSTLRQPIPRHLSRDAQRMRRGTRRDPRAVQRRASRRLAAPAEEHAPRWQRSSCDPRKVCGGRIRASAEPMPTGCPRSDVQSKCSPEVAIPTALEVARRVVQ